MSPINLKLAASDAAKKEARNEREAIVEEFLHEYHHGVKKSGFDWATVFWIFVFIIGAGAVLLIKNYYYPGPIFPTRPSSGSSSEASQPQPPLIPLVQVTVTPAGFQTLDVIPVVVNGVLQSPVWLNPETSGMPQSDQFPDPTREVCQDVNGFSLPFSNEARDVYLVKIYSSSATNIFIVPGEIQITSCTLKDQFFLYQR